MKHLLLMIILLSLVSCSSSQGDAGVIKIYGNLGGHGMIEGMGVCIGTGKILTSTHVVNDDRFIYRVMESGGWVDIGEAKVKEKSIVTDIASLELPQGCDGQREYTGKEGVQIGDVVSIPVIRSGSILTLTGNIVSLTGRILAYDGMGRVQMFSGILITDQVFLPGDSGSPILDEQGRVIDVVHVSAK